MSTNEGFSGVSNCYVFKSRLQEYAQKAGVPTPVYETIKEGPSHEPAFRSTVIVNNVRYESLPGFFNRKAAEQSAAEVALLELAKHGEVNECIALPIHETGLCKNLLQEYAQKMNYAIPLYQCRKEEAPGRVHFICTVEIGGIRYIGAKASTKKEAEIKAARTALLAIRTSASELSSKTAGNSQLTVIPCKKRGSELANNPDETVNVPKAKKARFKKKMLKRKLPGGRKEHTQVQGLGSLVNMHVGQEGLKMDQTHTSGFQVMGTEHFTTEATTNCQEGISDIVSNEIQSPAVRNALPHHAGDDSKSMHSATSNCNQSISETPNMDTSSVPCGCTTALMKEVNEATPNVDTSSASYGHTNTLMKEVNEATPNVGTSFTSYGPNTLAREVNEATEVMDVASMMNGSVLGQIESSCVIPGLNQSKERIQAGTSQA